MSPSGSSSMSKEPSSSETRPSTAQDKSGEKATPRQAEDKAGTATGTKPSTQSSGDMSKDSKSKAASENPPSGSSKASSDTSPAAKSGNTAADSKSGTSPDNKTTTGNAATSATAAPPAEKQTQIASAIKQERVQETTNVNFNISVGTVVPTSVHFYPLPSRIVEIYPEWRGYEFILVKGRYVVVRPQTHEIIYIIEG
jgi:hypothetical protein